VVGAATIIATEVEAAVANDTRSTPRLTCGSELRSQLVILGFDLVALIRHLFPMGRVAGVTEFSHSVV